MGNRIDLMLNFFRETQNLFKADVVVYGLCITEILFELNVMLKERVSGLVV